MCNIYRRKSTFDIVPADATPSSIIHHLKPETLEMLHQYVTSSLWSWLDAFLQMLSKTVRLHPKSVFATSEQRLESTYMEWLRDLEVVSGHVVEVVLRSW